MRETMTGAAMKGEMNELVRFSIVFVRQVANFYMSSF